MDVFPGKIRSAATNPWFALVCGVATIAGLILTLALAVWPEALRAERLGPQIVPFVPYLQALAGVAAVLVCIFLTFVVYHWAQAQNAIKITFEKRHEISHVYRNQYAAQVLRLSVATTTRGIEHHAGMEVDAISTVTQKIALMYRELLGAPCMAEVFLCDWVKNVEVCRVVARSENGTARDRNGDQDFTIRQDLNTAFVDARKTHPSGGTSHFLSGDLQKLADAGNYHDERKNWRHLYQSRLVVPIRYQRGNQEIGFLSVDTRSRNRLNHTFHVELLASLADDMYMFLHVTRATMLAELHASELYQRSNTAQPNEGPLP